MKRTFDLVAAVFCLTVATVADASPAAAIDCTCRAPGRRVELGATACLPTPNGPRLARCVMDVNITSWQNLDLPCPVSSAPEPAPTRRTASLAATPATTPAAP